MDRLVNTHSGHSFLSRRSYLNTEDSFSVVKTQSTELAYIYIYRERERERDVERESKVSEALWLTCLSATLYWTRSNSVCTVIFTRGLISFGNVWISLTTVLLDSLLH